ncbi:MULTISPECIES: hypothetical protein [unclassified Streptomyces]|uniref:hypothetical protein n=1 Tax=Streptomyces TaxID=1883 RepID=UPI00035F6BD5|nr:MULTISPECIES: hypothetical protein [unclassified Streptomyces]MYR67847.1 hypothetical protein [Streptomyces sp. SID4939]MYT67810.1 hypothetical protein [Streptomyces sp. SID8357]MYT86654.1 hypothetical protein [Streptomyces sp. SID8360]MYW41370.1 hypothetical protein [Streptomyces sp. SID1]MYX72407.1 hypothetical protein [Streptomyces sp. SID3915]
MIIKHASRLTVMAALLLTGIGVSGCTGDTDDHRPSDAASEASAPALGGSTPAAGSSSAVKPASTATAAAQQFAQALARGDAELACGLADARLRAVAPGNSCAAAFAELAADDRYVFTQAACVDASASYKADGDPQDTADSVRVDIDCAQGYTWLRVHRVGSVWRVTDINSP